MMSKTRKAQIQMTETIFVIFIILIIIVLGFVAYSKFQEGVLKEQQKTLRNIRVIQLAHRLSAWPELECSVASTSKFVCVDETKLMVLGNFINQSKQQSSYAFNYYFDILKNSKITVTEVYPSYTKTLGSDYWVLYENPGKTKNIDVVWVPVNIYNPLTKNYAFGVMELEIYE